MDDRKDAISKSLDTYLLKDLIDITDCYDYNFEGKSTLIGHHNHHIHCVDVLSCGKIVSGNGISIKIWDPITLDCLDEFPCLVRCTECSGMSLACLSNKYIACGSLCTNDRSLKIINLETKEYEPIDYNNAVYCLRSLQSNLFTSGSLHEINIWNAENKSYKINLKGYRGIVSDIRLISDQYIVGSSSEGEIKIWNIVTKECIQTMYAYSGVYSMTVLSDRQIITASDTGLKIWSPGSEAKMNYSYKSTIRSGYCWLEIIKLPDDRFISYSLNQKIKLWSLESGIYQPLMYRSTNLTNDDPAEHNFFTLLADGRVVSGSSSGLLKIWR